MRMVWLDALTPKQAMLLGNIALKLLNQGFDVIVTARNYDYTCAVLKNLGIRFIRIGGYSDDLFGKLVEEAHRMLKLLEILNNRFDLAIAYPNPVLARTAFGLGKPYIALTDSPHSEAASRLSLPLARYVIISKCIPVSAIEPYVYKIKTDIIQYTGVDEVEWLKEAKPDLGYVRSLGLEPFNYVVVRPPEIKAAYYRRYTDAIDLFKRIVDKILELGLKLVYIPRYVDDGLANYLSGNENVFIPSTDVGIIGYHVLYYALATITGGGTLARESALLGTPGITFFPEELYVDKCLQELGLPLFRCADVSNCLQMLSTCIRNTENLERLKQFSISILKTFEKPSDVILRLIRDQLL